MGENSIENTKKHQGFEERPEVAEYRALVTQLEVRPDHLQEQAFVCLGEEFCCFYQSHIDRMVSIVKDSLTDICCIIPTFSAKNELRRCAEALRRQRTAGGFEIVVIDNGATIETKRVIDEVRKNVTVLQSPVNRGFAGGVNIGIRYALEKGFSYIALLNDDAFVRKGWLEQLHETLKKHKEVGIATSKMLCQDGQKIDSTGECYSTWGLPFPRGRNEHDVGQYDTLSAVFGASGGASLYRAELFEQVGLFDEDLFAYYEDVDLSFRAQLAGWSVRYVPSAVVYHRQGVTSSKIPGFATYHTFKNIPLLLWKNVPLRLLPVVLPRFTLAHIAIFVSSSLQGRIWWVLKGFTMSLILLPKKLMERRQIQKNSTVSTEHIRSIMTHDLPPNASRLRRLRGIFARSPSQHHTGE
jgi:GT2 family glycosyltransferase